MRQAQEQRYETRKGNTNKRYAKVKQRVDELCSIRIEGLRPSFEDVIKKVADEFGYTPAYVSRILKKV